ncbi:arylsulfatase [Mariniblastus fucicola]|uniref:Arylsulfatase n=1 Tax=Mariniblastus fucicola TaxID=980251 RepID=A0A5B9P8T1_9BACT|nr:arylsulfatase [Mariniblastus fucicola]QEG21290.1 Arylsulfatase [Mariniblastus fucicola]
MQKQLLAVITLILLSAFSTATAEQPPNIVLIVADDLGYAELGCYGQKWIKTPHIDSIARDGMRFTNHYCGQAVCAPSRCSLVTGMHQGHAEIRGNGNPEHRGKPRPKEMYFPGQMPISDSAVTIFELLKTKGYATAAIGKWGLGDFSTSGSPGKQGVDLFYGFNCQVHAHNHYPQFLWRNETKENLKGNDRSATGKTFSQDRFVDVALEFVDENHDKPFLLYLPFAIPHLSIQVPDPSVEEYLNTIPEEDYKHRGYLPHPNPRAGYAAMITHMDRGIGQILERLKQHGIDDNTLVIFTSDNGPTFDRLGGSDSDFFESSGPMRGRKGSLLEGGIRVPMVAKFPGKIEAGSVSDHRSAFWDYVPTLCEAAGIESPDNVDGISFFPTLVGGDQPEHEFLYWEFPSYGGQQAVRLGERWKGLREKLQRKPNAPIQLYDLQNDIGESKDMASEHPEIVQQIETIMKDQHVDSETFPFPALDK